MIDDTTPESIGSFRILEELGRGGMGVVYLAEQQEPVRRQVALKVLKQGMDTQQVVARFEVELQAMALMNHPAIARVFDAGATPQGRPYLVMEPVRGVPITEHCDHQRLTIRQRLELLLQVCDGVQHAHHKAVIHRDLKPSNVLVAIRDDQPERVDHAQSAREGPDKALRIAARAGGGHRTLSRQRADLGSASFGALSRPQARAAAPKRRHSRLDDRARRYPGASRAP